MGSSCSASPNGHTSLSWLAHAENGKAMHHMDSRSWSTGSCMAGKHGAGIVSTIIGESGPS